MSEPIIGTGRETSGVPVRWGASQDHAACGAPVTRLDLIAALREVYQWWSLGDLAELADSILAHLPGAQTAAGSLLSLAAELDRYADETSAEADAHAARGDDDAGIMAAGASGAWRAAADMARQRARGGQSGHSGPFPVSQGAPDGTEALRARIRDLEAALYDVLAHFTEHGHPGYEAVRTGWQPAERVKRWRVILHQPQGDTDD